MNSAQYYSMMLVNAKRFVSVCDSSLPLVCLVDLLFHSPTCKMGLTTPNAECFIGESEVFPQQALSNNNSLLKVTELSH